MRRKPSKWQKFKRELRHISNRQWQLLILAVTFMCILCGGFLLVIPQLQQKVRAAQIESVVFPVTKESKVKLLSYGKVEEVVKSKKKSIIIYIPQKGKYQKNVLKILQDEAKTKALKGDVYLYPFVYDTPNDLENFRLDDKHCAIVAYQNNQQVKRKTLKNKQGILDLVDEINQFF